MLVLALMSTANLWGETVSIDFSAQGYTNAQAIESADIAEGINVTFDKGTNSNSVAPTYYTSGNAVRCYGGNYFVVSSSVGDIKEITLTFGSGGGTNEISADCGVFAGSIWTGTANAVKFTIGGDSGHRKILGISVTYELRITPSINASDITIEADATSGAIDYTIKNPVEGKQLTANSDASWISDVTVTDTQVTFTTAKNETSAERTAKVSLNYEGAKEKTVTVTQKKAIPTYASLAELVAAGEPAGEMVRVTLTDEVIKSINISGDYRTGIVIQVGERDVTIYCYGVPESWIAGGTVSGTLTCVWARLNDALWELCPDDWNDLNYTDPVGAHNVNISENIEHGTVKANPKRGIEGAQITLTATPDEGYNFGSYTVKDAAENNITVTDSKFTMPASDVTVSATFVEKPQYKVTYMSLGANCGEETVLEGDCIADAPTVNTPDGWMWQFAGWTTDASYADDTTAPEFFTPTTPITANTTLYAVFSKIIRVSGEYFWNLVTDASTLNS
ncbi:MAG: BACON domain-containing carbohydrate-binding protein, partial [Prevotellaceae bacterium]|nr:BACON domain-containing carbohydrate-binding protein [Prevotellaceae bacterium]